jgi:hypothetical protein
MHMETARIDRATARPLSPTDWTHEDPLDADAPTDDVVVTTKRGLCRLATLAAEVGGRFQREGSPHDPVAWLLAPRVLFDGSNALDACLDRDAFLRATLLHSLSMGLDADPQELDELLEDDEGPDDREENEMSERKDDLPEPFAGLLAGPFLFSATIEHVDEESQFHAFHASIAADAKTVVERLVARYGSEMVSKAEIVIGFDRHQTIASELVSASTARLLSMIEKDPESDFACGLDVNIEQRFSS